MPEWANSGHGLNFTLKIALIKGVRLTGRLFYNISGRGLNPRSLSLNMLVQVFT